MSINVSLAEELLDFVKAKVASGRYASTTEVISDALRLLEKSEQDDAEKLRWLQRAWSEGLASGKGAPLDTAAIKAEGRRRLTAQG